MSAGHSTAEIDSSRRWSEARPAGFQKMAEGSFATATNVSPMPTARAPTPMRRNVAEDVPALWPPSEPWAWAVIATNNAASVRKPVRVSRAGLGVHRNRPTLAPGIRRSEVDIELQPPLRARAVVRRVVDLGDVREIVQAADVVGV